MKPTYEELEARLKEAVSSKDYYKDNYYKLLQSIEVKDEAIRRLLNFPKDMDSKEVI